MVWPGMVFKSRSGYQSCRAQTVEHLQCWQAADTWQQSSRQPLSLGPRPPSLSSLPLKVPASKQSSKSSSGQADIIPLLASMGMSSHSIKKERGISGRHTNFLMHVLLCSMCSTKDATYSQFFSCMISAPNFFEFLLKTCQKTFCHYWMR